MPEWNAVIYVLLGWGLGQIGAYLNDRRRWKHEDGLRHVDEERKACIDAIGALRSMQERARLFAHLAGTMEGVEEDDALDTLNEEAAHIAEAIDEVWDSVERLGVFAPKPVYNQAVVAARRVEDYILLALTLSPAHEEWGDQLESLSRMLTTMREDNAALRGRIRDRLGTRELDESLMAPSDKPFLSDDLPPEVKDNVFALLGGWRRGTRL